jgi:ABC-2 type transport system ATP-binding protein
MTSNGIALRCAGLVKRYGNVVAVNGLDLEVRVGECFGLLGPNGAGKTTTIEILEGLLPHDGGDVLVLGQRWGEHDRALRQQLGIQLQETQLAEKLTVAETLRLFRAFYDRGHDIGEIIALLELESKRDTWVGKLSGGQRQRLAVGCALVGQPAILFLDEPTTGLDPQSRRQLWRLLETFRGHGGTVLLTTHYMDEAEILCDRVAVVDQGRVIALGTPRELIATLGAEHVLDVALEPPGTWPALDDVRNLPGVTDVREEAGRLMISATAVHLAVPALLQHLSAGGSTLASLTMHNATLEDVFVRLTGRHLRDE